MVELARALEIGSGVVRDDSRAAALYEKAAQGRPTFTSNYSPPVRLGGAGQVMMIPNAKRSARRARIEQVFARQKDLMGLFICIIGFRRAEVKIR